MAAVVGDQLTLGSGYRTALTLTAEKSMEVGIVVFNLDWRPLNQLDVKEAHLSGVTELVSRKSRKESSARPAVLEPVFDIAGVG